MINYTNLFTFVNAISYFSKNTNKLVKHDRFAVNPRRLPFSRSFLQT